MKQSIFILLLSTLALGSSHAFTEYPATEPITEPITKPITVLDYQQDQELFVVASSGLKLRSTPDFGARVLAIMDYGESVRIINDTVHWARYDRVEWLDGHWIYVQYGDQVGYAFDGFLSTMPMPFFGYDVVNCEDLPILLESYLSDMTHDGYLGSDYSGSIETTVDSGYVGIQRSFPGEHELSYTRSPDQTTVQVSLQQVRIAEAYHILINLLDYCPEKADLIDDLVYVENEDGHVVRIQSRGTDRIRIIQESESTVLLKIVSPCSVDTSEPARS